MNEETNTPPETLAAILADYRADIPAMTSGELPHPTPEYLRILLDRIEAAVKREYAQWHGETNAAKEERNRIACKMRYEFAAKCRACKSAPGNAAAMREALERCNELFRCDDDNKSRLCNLARKADEATKAALAAPPRNCDRFATAKEALDAFIRVCMKAKGAHREAIEAAVNAAEKEQKEKAQ